MSYKELDILLVKEQVSSTAEATELAVADFSAVGDDFSLEYKQDTNVLPFARCNLGKAANLPGKSHVEFYGKKYMSVNGISEPGFSKFLKSSGFTMTRLTSTTTGNTTEASLDVVVASVSGIEVGTLCSFSAGFAQTTQIYEVDAVDTDTKTLTMDTAAASNQTGVTVTFYIRQRRWQLSSDNTAWKYLTMWKYTGLLGTDASVLTKGYSILNDVVIESEIGQLIAMNFTGKGPCSVQPAAGTYPTDTITPPSETILKMMKASTAAFQGATYNILGFSVTPKITVALVPTGRTASGYRYGDIADMDIEVKLKVMQESIATNDPYAPLKSGATGSFSIICGDTLYKAGIYSPNDLFQITDIATGEDSKSNAFEITGKILNNDLYIETGSA